MHSNLLYRGFLAAIFLTSLWYTGIAAYRYYTFSSLTAQTHPLSMQWTVHEVAEDDFYLEAAYSFNVDNKSFNGKTAWPRLFYRNKWAAEKDAPHMEKQHQIIWFNPHNPNHSSLQKSFPIKECISAVFLWGLFLYFLWLGYYVTKFKT